MPSFQTVPPTQEQMSYKPGCYVNIPSANSNSMSQLNLKMQDYSALVTQMDPSQAGEQVIDLDGDGMAEYSSVSTDRYQTSLHKNVTSIYPNPMQTFLEQSQMQ